MNREERKRLVLLIELVCTSENAIEFVFQIPIAKMLEKFEH